LKLEKVNNCNVKAAQRRANNSGLFLAEIVLCMHTNFKILIYSNPYFLKDLNILTVR